MDPSLLRHHTDFSSQRADCGFQSARSCQLASVLQIWDEQEPGDVISRCSHVGVQNSINARDIVIQEYELSGKTTIWKSCSSGPSRCPRHCSDAACAWCVIVHTAVKIYTDVFIHHTCASDAGEDQLSTRDPYFTASREEFPSVPYSSSDFNDDKCSSGVKPSAGRYPTLKGNVHGRVVGYRSSLLAGVQVHTCKHI